MAAPLTTPPGTLVRVKGERGRFRWLTVLYSRSGVPSVRLMDCRTKQYKHVRPDVVIRVRKRRKLMEAAA